MILGPDLMDSLRERGDWARDLLCRMIEFPSTTGAEGDVQEFLGGVLSGLGFPARLVPIDESIVHDADHTPVPGHESYRGRPNILVDLAGTGGGRSAILNTHVDVVPGPDGLFSPRVEGETIQGRGACDAKGQVVTVLLALSALKGLGIRLKGDVQAQFVIEEEAGGNGSLAVLLGGNRADVAVVLEPTGLTARSANRGAVWFKLGVTGRSVHMGRYREGVSAVDEMAGLLPLLKEYEAFLRSASKGQAGFPDDPSPVVVNVGRIRGGDWPSTVPGECVVEGGIAFLPNRTIPEILAEVSARLEAKAGTWARKHYVFEQAGLHNEAFATPADHPAVRLFRQVAEATDGRQGLAGWDASCDGRLFFHRGGMPTIVFGAGDLCYAHSSIEQVRMNDILIAAGTIARFLVDWCGVEGQEDDHAR